MIILSCFALYDITFSNLTETKGSSTNDVIVIYNYRMEEETVSEAVTVHKRTIILNG